MPSTFDILFANALPGLYSVIGTGASYTAPTPPGTTTVGLTVLLNALGDKPESPPRVPGEMPRAVIEVRQSELAAAHKFGRFTITDTGEVWTLEDAPVGKNGQWFCQCSRSA